MTILHFDVESISVFIIFVNTNCQTLHCTVKLSRQTVPLIVEQSIGATFPTLCSQFQIESESLEFFCVVPLVQRAPRLILFEQQGADCFSIGGSSGKLDAQKSWHQRDKIWPISH